MIPIGDAGEKPIVIQDIEIDPPVIPEYGTATITIRAKSLRGWPLEFEVSVDEGTIERTNLPNVFLWHGPKSPQRDRGLHHRRARSGMRRGR